MGIAYLLVFSIRVFLLVPKNKKKIFNKKIPLTPAFLYKKKKWLITKLTSELRDYLRDSENDSEETNIAKWEHKAYYTMWKKMRKFDDINWIPHKILEAVRSFISSIALYFARTFFRSFVPILLRRYKAMHYIELLDKKLDMDIITEYFDKYVYKYLLIFFVGLAFVIGFWNMIFYWIIH